MRRLPALAFGLMVAATIGAFFLTQHLKSENPVVWDSPFPIPSAFDPISGRDCVSASGQRLNYRSTFLNFGISHADTVGVYIVKASDALGKPVATVSPGRQMQASQPGAKQGTATFVWNGRLSDGAYAPDGNYYFRIVLHNAGTTANLIHAPVRVLTVPPRPRVLSVKPTAGATAAVLSPPKGAVRIRWTPAGTPGGYRRVWLDIYRTDVSGRPRLVAKLAERPTRYTATWNGEIVNRPAPAGTYLIGITAQNAACRQVSWPVVKPPTDGARAGIGVTIRYLSVTPPLSPTAAGSRVKVPVVSQGPITYQLRGAGTSKVLADGTGGGGHAGAGAPVGADAIVRLPRRQPGLYELTVHSAGHTSTVPVVASATGKAAARARVLVVLPALTWIGDSPVDDTGDGVPDTLRSGSAALLRRPLVDGLPATVDYDAALLKYLRGEHLDFQVTTDVALDRGVGPALAHRWGVLFADGEDYLPAALAARLRRYVSSGGRVLALGTGTFTGTSRITDYPADPRASAPVISRTDVFGARRGREAPTKGEPITELSDHLNLLGSGFPLSGFRSYQAIEPPRAERARSSAAGIADGSPAIVAYRFGAGSVIEVGLPDFGASLAHDVDARELLANIWRRLAKRQ